MLNAQSIVDYIVDKDLTDIVLLGHSLVGQSLRKLLKRLIAFDGSSSDAFVLNDGEPQR